jgi:hypothetical protein
VRKKISIVGLVVLTIIGLLVACLFFTTEMKWDLADFIMAGILFFSTGVAGIFIWEWVKISRWRIFMLVLLAFFFVFIWAELAVGLVGSPFAGN